MKSPLSSVSSFDSQANNLEGLGLRPNTKQVLVALAKLGRSPAADIAAHLNKPKSSIYDGLNELARLNLVVEESSDTSRVFSLAKPEQIAQIKARQMSLVESSFSEILKIAQNPISTVARPRIRFYSGVEGIRQAFRDTPWRAKCKESYLMWPMKDMIETLGEPFLKQHGGERTKHKVMLYSIRKESDRQIMKEQYDWLKSDRLALLREVRYAPKNIDWSMSFWVYGDQTVFAGSGSEHFAFIVHSREFASLMTLLWKQTWERSTK